MAGFTKWAKSKGADVESLFAQESQEPSQKWANWDLPTAKGKVQEQPTELGTGACYEVVSERLAIRAAPSLAAPTQGAKVKGTIVELFEWDDTRQWRRFVDPKLWTSGWVLLDHPDIGPLLRPVGLPFQVMPLDPLCVAVRENCLCDVRRFLDEGLDPNSMDADGKRPLMLAAESDNLECVALLLHARADLSATRHGEALGGTALRFSAAGPVRALLMSLAGQIPDKNELAQAFANPEARKLVPDHQEKLEKASIREPPVLRQPVEARKMVHAHQDKLENASVLEPPVLQQPQQWGLPQASSPETSVPSKADGLALPRASVPEPTMLREGQELGPLGLPKAWCLEHSWSQEANGTGLPQTAAPEPLVSGEASGYESAEARRPRQYEVVVRSCAIRVAPAATAETIGARARGKIVELHEYDETRNWRRIAASEGSEGLPDTVGGWMMLEHEEFGPLLEPVEPEAEDDYG